MMKRSTQPEVAGLLPNRACGNCIRIKVKCIPLEGSAESVCQRCHRLGKTCSTPVPVARKRRGPTSRVVQLEERMNRLAALLPQQQPVSENSSRTSESTFDRSTGRSVPHDSGTTETTPSNQSLNTTSEEQRFEPSSWSSGVQPIARTGSPSMLVPHPPGRKDGSELLKDTFCPIYLGSELESQLFTEFRTHMIKHFPFIAIDPEISAEVFKEQKPFSYWACILAATHRDRQLIAALHQEMMKALGQRMLVAGGKTIDHLQGILLIIAWHQNTMHYNAQFMNLLHLAKALLADMGILRPIRPQDKIRIASDIAAMIHGFESNSVTINNDQKRALLGCFCLFSKVCLTFNRVNSMRYSQHIDDCVESLKTAMEYESDLLLVELVRVHRIFGKYLQVDSGTSLFSNMHRSVFQDELQQYRQSLNADLKGNKMLEMELLSGSLCMLEPSYTAEYRDKIDQLNVFQACTDIINQLTRLMISFSNQEWPYAAVFNTMALVQLLVVSSRISFFGSNGLAAQHLLSDLNLGEVLNSLTRKFQSVHESEVAAYPNHKHWRFEIYAKKAQHIRSWFDAKVAASERAANSVADEAVPIDFNETLFGDFFDDSLWEGLMTNWYDF